MLTPRHDPGTPSLPELPKVSAGASPARTPNLAAATAKLPALIRDLPPLTPRAQRLVTLAREIHQSLQSSEPAILRTYIVGGTVRDIVRQAEPRDLDLEVVAPWEALLGALDRSKLVSYVVARPNYSSVMAKLHNGESVDIVCRPPQVDAPDRDQLEGASRRRGFAMNSMYLDALTGEHFDFHGGAEDLQHGRLRLIPGIDVAKNSRLLVVAAAAMVRFGLMPDCDTQEVLSSIAHRIAERSADEKFPVGFIGYMNRVLERGIDGLAFCHALASFGYFDQLFKGYSTLFKTLLLAAATASPADGKSTVQFHRHQRIDDIGAFIASRSGRSVSRELGAALAQRLLVGLGAADRGSISSTALRAVLRQQELIPRRASNPELADTIAVVRCDESTTQFARHVIESAPATSRIARTHLVARRFLPPITETSGDSRLFIGSIKFLEEFQHRSAMAFAVVMGSEGNSIISRVLSEGQASWRWFGPNLCRVHLSPQEPVDILWFPSLPEDTTASTLLKVPNHNSRERLWAASGALYDLVTGQLHRMPQ